MPSDSPQIVTGMRQPHDTGQVSRPVQEPPVVPVIRHVALAEGEVEFNSLARSYRVEFQKPKQQMNQATGEIIEEGPRNFQFKDRRVVTSDQTLIHQAKGCQNIPNAMVAHEHTKLCSKTCAIERCILGHQNPKNASQLYFPKHPSYGIKGDFWDAAEMQEMVAKANKTSAIENFRKLAESVPPEEMREILAATGIDTFQLPPREMPKEASK